MNQKIDSMPIFGHGSSHQNQIIDASIFSSLQNVAGFDEISSGQTLQVGADIGAGFRKIGAETGKSGAEVKKLTQK